MGALMALILQIILGLVMKQKKESSKKITGLKNPSQLQISQAYKKLIEDIKKMHSIGLNVSHLVNAIKLNLAPDKAARLGVRAYQESQFFLDRLIGNKTEEKNFTVPISSDHVEKITIKKQNDYIDCYFPFACNSFKSIVSPRKIFLVRHDKKIFVIDDTIEYNPNMLEYLEKFETVDYKQDTIRFLEIVQKLLCNYYNSKIAKKWYKVITNKVLTEKNITVDFTNYDDQLFGFLGQNKLFYTTSCYIVAKEYHTRYSNNYIKDNDLLKTLGYSSYNKGTKNLQNLQLLFNNEIFKTLYEV